MYNCFDIAKEFLSIAERENKSIDTMKLLKLTYIAHGWYLAFKDKPLFKNEIQAWKYGPVIPDLYGVIKRYGTGTVPIDIVDLYSQSKLSQEDQVFIENVWNAYKENTGLELSERTHRENTPWYQVYDKDNIEKRQISNQAIQSYYKTKIDTAKPSSNA